jgi:hypothetical protein
MNREFPAEGELTIVAGDMFKVHTRYPSQWAVFVTQEHDGTVIVSVGNNNEFDDVQLRFKGKEVTTVRAPRYDGTVLGQSNSKVPIVHNPGSLGHHLVDFGKVRLNLTTGAIIEIGDPMALRLYTPDRDDRQGQGLLNEGAADG